MNRAIASGGTTAGSAGAISGHCSQAAGRFSTETERMHLREMFSQYTQDELGRVIAELEQIIRQRDS